MAQRILQRGEIETLAQRSIPRVRLPDRGRLFQQRASRLRDLVGGSPIGDYLRVLACLADAQHAATAHFATALPAPEQIQAAREHRMPPIHAASWPRDPQWRGVLLGLSRAVVADANVPAALTALDAKLRSAPAAWIEGQADALLTARHEQVDAAAAPFIAAALQVHWLALTAAFSSDSVALLDVPGVCPLCGTLPAASIVAAQSAHQGYRYLHCALCATEWHMVRVHCSHCGATGKDIAYRYLEKEGAQSGEQGLTAVRAETCEQCHAYRKIVYQEKDAQVEPLADDVASIALDLMLGADGYHRVSPNPLLWQPAQA
jgi:FdhE protein